MAALAADGPTEPGRGRKPREVNALKVGLDGDTLGRKRTGDESYLASLMRGLGRVDRENDYTVYVRDAAAVQQSFRELARFRFRTVRPRSIWLRHPIGFPLALRRDPVDLLHVQYFVPPLRPCPVVLTVHDISFAVRPDFFTRRDRILLGALVPPSLRRADRVITDAEFTRDELSRVFDLDPSRIHVVPLAADPRYHPLDRAQCRRTVAQRHDITEGFILYVGTLQPRKKVDMLIRAYGRLRQRTKLPHKLVLVGKPKYKYGPVFDAIKEFGVGDDILFTGFVPDEDLPVYYNAAALFAFPSLYEGFGLPVVEAMACGTPVVTLRNSCLPEVAGEAAKLVEPTDIDGLCDAMTAVLEDPAVADRMREEGLRRAETFSWDRTARETLAVYRRVLQER